MSNPKELFNAVQSGDAVAVERIQSTPLVLEARRKEIEAGCREVVEILTGL
jgi:hypothetical protein